VGGDHGTIEILGTDNLDEHRDLESILAGIDFVDYYCTVRPTPITPSARRFCGPHGEE
jgi:hypothetical protein